jgi:hypothetical protein
MADIVENSQIEEYIKNLKGKKTYEQNKATKLGFSNFEEYIANKISKQFSDPVTVCKAPRQRIKTKKKIEPNKAKTCGCC